MPATHRLIEGIASDGHRLWLSSVVDRQILEWRGHRLARVIALPGDVARPLGIAYDPRRRWLWIATDCPAIAAPGACTGGALVAIDLRGRVMRRLVPAGPAHFGDVSVGDDVVQVSDSATGAVYTCRDDCTALTVLVAPGIGKSAQSSVRYDGGRRLLVADYGAGLFSIDAAGARTPVVRADGRPLKGLDGLARAGDLFVAVQNSQSPGLVIGFKIAPDGAHLADLRLLAGGPVFVEPTQIVVVGKRVLVVADAQWAAHDPAAGAVRQPQRSTPIMAVPLP